ncbi:MAG TPA: hypothetical protein VFG53_20295 [Anaeromyxobacter sp.]|nr:hypothetical protein [Anaeromyxobacter sp.]
MNQDRHELLRELEERLSRVSRWLAGRRPKGDQAWERFQALLESVRRDITRARQAGAQEVREVAKSARASLDDMERDFEVPHVRSTFRGEELQALRRHMKLTARLLPHLSNLDDPGWRPAHEEYERSWDELRRAFEADGGAAAP